jgi:hypothetical protein
LDATRLIFALADLHIGSLLGLLPPGAEMRDGVNKNPVGQNALQQWLWACFTRSLLWMEAKANGDPYCLLLPGDLIEGNHHGAKQLCLPEIADQIEAAILLLKPLAERAAETHIAVGTECHTGMAEWNIAKELPRATAHDKLIVNCHGCRFVIHHHISTSSRVHLRASKLSINLANEQLEATRNGEQPPVGLVAAHCHTFDYYVSKRAFCITCAPWQGLTRHGFKVVAGARTSPGIVSLDWRKKEPGEIPDIDHEVYDCPPPTEVVL